MYLENLSLQNYRNIDKLVLNPDPQINFLIGNNGEGKTNIIESINVLSTGKSFRTNNSNELIKFNANSCIINAIVYSDNIKNKLRCTVLDKKRLISIDNKPVIKYSQLHGRFPSIVFTSEDLLIIKKGPDSRRKFIDKSLYNSDLNYVDLYNNYYTILKHRNVILRTNKIDQIELWTNQLASTGVKLIEHRSKYINQLNELLNLKNNTIFNISNELLIKYEPDIDTTDSTTLFNILMNNKEKDIKYNTTTRGPHRDDLVFLIDGKPLKYFGSQGQQRNFILLLKLSEIEYFNLKFKISPIILLDDVASELDSDVIYKIMNYLPATKSQIFISTTSLDPFKKSIATECKIYKIKSGNIIDWG